MCTVSKLTRSSFYTWKATHARRASRICADGVLGARIAAVFAEEDGLYGAQRITASLNDDERFARVNHKKVARIMKNMKLRGFSKRRRCVTTQRSASTPVFEDLVKRRFHAQAPNQVYVGDIYLFAL
ncbi:IS3 family transposase [Corynebacterium diphtheriae]|nr:IS3 family transposase [Corynebacterium diphtheriae]